MQVGDAVTVVLPGTGDLRQATVRSLRDNGQVLCRWSAGGAICDMWIWLEYIDTGETDLFGRKVTTITRRLTPDQALVLGALFAAGRSGLIDHDHRSINALPKLAAEARRIELAQQGLVERTYDTRSMGRSDATVHRITPAGRAVWLAHQRSRSSA